MNECSRFKRVFLQEKKNLRSPRRVFVRLVSLAQPTPSGRLIGGRTLQLLDLGDKCQAIQEPLIAAREAAQSPPASPDNGPALGGPCEPPSPIFLPILPSMAAPAHSTC